MANQEQLERLLDDGVEEWNKWREENPKVEIDLSYSDLANANLSGADHFYSKFHLAKLRGVNLKFANLHSAKLDYANLTRTKLYGANLSNATLKAANLSDAELGSANLSDADLREANLSKANLEGANLRNADLRGANLRDANLNKANLQNADLHLSRLIGTNLSQTNLTETDFSAANLSTANLSYANLNEANLSDANLSDANFSYANLSDTNLIDAKFFNSILSATNFLGAVLYHTTISKVNLLNAKGLYEVIHRGPSSLSQDTLQLSEGQLPDVFLKGCGLSPWEILSAKLHNPKLTPNQITDIIYEMDRLRNEAPLQVHNLFISYSHGDARFVDRIGELFDAKDVRYWRDMKDATAGPLDQIVVRAMRQNPTVLLVFSQHSVDSDWVEFELQKARELEKEMGRYVICPVALDDSWRTAKWSPILLNQIKKYNILDFSRWEDVVFLEAQFTKLLNGLHLFYKEDRKEE